MTACAKCKFVNTSLLESFQRGCLAQIWQLRVLAQWLALSISAAQVCSPGKVWLNGTGIGYGGVVNRFESELFVG